jgi:enoyl-[acyl-carrier protein] reductase I
VDGISGQCGHRAARRPASAAHVMAPVRARDTLAAVRGMGIGQRATARVRITAADRGVTGRDRALDAAGASAADSVADFSGKHGLSVGVATKRSIAWAIAQATASRGARLAITYQGRFEENVQELSQGLAHAPLVLPCDVTSDADIESVFARIDQDFGGLDFVVHGAAFAPRDELTSPFVRTTREGFRLALDVSAYSLIALARAAAPLMEKRGGGSILTLTYLGSSRVFPNYNVMGVAKAALEASVRYLAADLGPTNIRVNAISAGPIKTLAAAGIGGFSTILNIYRERAPLRRNVEAAEVGEAAAFLLSDAGKAITGEVLMVDAGFHVTGT